MNSLDPFFAPKSVAVVGASPGKSGFANLALRNLRNHGASLTITAIHPGYTEVDGFPCRPSLASIEQRPDLCIIGVRADRVAEVLEECVREKIPAVTIIASGFAEMANDDGRALQARLDAIRKQSNTRIAGPNTIGIGNFLTGAVGIASANIPAVVPKGATAIVTQSGGVGYTLMLRGISKGLGFSHLVTLGNEIDVSLPEVIAYLGSQDTVRVVICYAEAIRGVRLLRDAIDVCSARSKPVLFLKGGLTSAGMAATASHTGAIAGDGSIWRSVIGQLGAIHAHSIDHALATAQIFSRHGWISGRNLGGFGVSGGLTVLFTDMLARAGLDLPRLSPATEAIIHDSLSDVTPNNPMDMGGQVLSSGGKALATALHAIADDPRIDALAFCVSPLLEEREKVINGAIVRAAQGLRKPLVILSYAGYDAGSVLSQGGLLVIDPPEAGVDAIKSWVNFKPQQHPPPGRPGQPPQAPPADRRRGEHAREALARQVKPGAKVLLEDDAKRLLQAYGIEYPDERIATDERSAILCATQIGYPVALKLLSTGMLHRGVGEGVLLHLEDEDAVSEGYRKLAATAARLADARILVQRMSAPGREFLIGAVRDRELGLALALGMGGAGVEQRSDALFCLPPVTQETIHRMLDAWPPYIALRDKGRLIDEDALVDAICGVSHFLDECGDYVEELDVNPVIVGAPGAGAVAVDALLVLRAPSDLSTGVCSRRRLDR